MKFLKDNKIGYRSTSVQSAEANYYSVQAQKIDLTRQVREVENSLSLLLGQQAQTIKRGKLEKYREDILGSLIINVSSEHKEKIKKYLDEKEVRWEEIINED